MMTLFNPHVISIVLLFIIQFQSNVYGFASQATLTPKGSSRGGPHWMGLYDKPLPPRPSPFPPRDEDSDEEEEDGMEDPEDVIQVSSRLFQFNVQGKEVNGLLPTLGRRLDKGIGCYFEPSDRIVQNLVEKTSCSVEDACWALEACKGDLTEAWTRISVARRNQLDMERSEQDDDDIDMEEEYEKKKRARIEKERTRERLERMKRSKPDADWLPIKNPKPIDDEPWFTG